MSNRLSVLVTGAAGLIGRGVVAALRSHARVERVHALVRAATALRPWDTTPTARVRTIAGDVTREDLGFTAAERARLAREVTTIVHLAANTSFSQSLDEARAVNRDGTRHLLAVTADWPRVSRWVYVSTAFVVGERTGVVRESDVAGGGDGWVNAYEQSKAEAEALVRAARADWVIARPSTVVCDDLTGRITQVNAVHRALRLYFGGLAAMLPGTEASALDVVTAAFVVRSVVRLTLGRGTVGGAYHLCAGVGAIPLDELLDVTHAAFARSSAWRRRGIARPLRADLETYRVFEQAVEDAGSERVRRAVRSLGHFVPQLAYPKRFDTTQAEAALGERAPAVREFWTRMVETLAGAEPAAALEVA
ncbi:MAG: SDR family oxidoreductase [Gemmatimonadota bacterium]|nr:SDR family oxidoreductase [Gemmatimonadota bacterium]